MATNNLASVHGVHLFRVDLCSINYKYIGETEKNLEHLFKVPGKWSYALI